MIIVWVLLAGIVGALLRYWASLKLSSSAVIFDWIFVVNTVGTLIAGLSWGFYSLEYINEDVLLIATVGFAGAFTTFSSWMHKLSLLKRAEKIQNVTVHIATGFVLFSLGNSAAKLLSLLF